MNRRLVGSAFTRDEIDAASTPQLWTALTRDADFSDKAGLPANPARRLRVQGTWYDADDEIDFFDKPRAALAVRGGWAELGDSIHHTRIYRYEEKGKTKYGMLRVFTVDLLKHRHEDLFAVEPDQSWISIRAAEPSIRNADLGELTYLGWLVAGDELLIDMSQFDGGHVGRATAALRLGREQRWRVSGFPVSTKISLVPALIAAEGIDKLLAWRSDLKDFEGSLRNVTTRWRIAVNVLFTQGNPFVIRRDSLGRSRLRSSAGLPVSWSVR